MSDQLQQYLATLMRSAKAEMDAQRDWEHLNKVGICINDFFACRARLAAMAEAGGQLRQPMPHPVPPVDLTGRGRPLMPHEMEEMDGGGNPALREALLRRGD